MPKLKLHVMVVHLHAHQSKLRVREAIKIRSLIAELIQNEEDLVIMGDFNTLSPYDSR